jgi:DNA-directed RNA polymerase specialized sigma24 family protein
MAMGRKTNNAVEARKLARERRMKLDADRAERDERIEAAAASVFVAQQDRVAALAAAAAAEAAIAGSVRLLLDTEGLTQTQTGQLLDLDVAEVRRLAKSTAGSAAGSEQVVGA